MVPENATSAMKALDKQMFQGRLLHIIPANVRIIRHQRESE